MQSFETNLFPVAPFKFEHTANFLHTFKADGIKKHISLTKLSFALTLQGQLVLVALVNKGSTQKPNLSCTLNAAELADDLINVTLEHLNFYLSLGLDLSPFYALAKKDDAFKAILDSLYGYHQVKFPSVFSCACWALITQRTPNSFAYKSMASLTELLGKSVTFQGRHYSCFPSPQDFLRKNAAAAILKATNNTRKTERLIPIAEAFATVDDDFLSQASYEELAKWLKGIHGLGQWSVDYILHRGLGRMERSPWSDTQILNSISKVYTNGFAISLGDAKKIAESYGWQQGHWVHYLKTAVESSRNHEVPLS